MSLSKHYFGDKRQKINKQNEYININDRFVDLTKDDKDEWSVASSVERIKYTRRELEQFQHNCFQAIWDNKVIIEKKHYTFEKVDHNDIQDNLYSFHSRFQETNLVERDIGNIGIDRFWFQSCIEDIDDLWGKDFHFPPENIDEQYYTLGKEYFKPISRNLTPRASRRELGRVFFSTETRFVNRDVLKVQDKPQKLRTYILKDGLKVYCKELGHEFRGVTYVVQGSGIIKYRVPDGKLFDKFYNYFNPITLQFKTKYNLEEK
jgi:hypothetical protein